MRLMAYRLRKMMVSRVLRAEQLSFAYPSINDLANSVGKFFSVVSST